MKDWLVLKLNGQRDYFLSPEGVTGYMESVLEKQKGKRILAVCSNNAYHHWTFGMVALSKAKTYVHIDRHPDDSTVRTVLDHYGHLGCGSFVQYMPKYAGVKAVRMIGPEASWCETHKELATYEEERDYIRRVEIADRFRMKKGCVEEVKKLLLGTDNVYLSIDLDILDPKLVGRGILSEEMLCDVVSWIVENKRIKGADIYPDNGCRSGIVRELKRRITSF